MSDEDLDVSKHILPVAATMVGVCVTVITIMQIAPKGSVSAFADVCVALDSLLFLGSTFFSYWSLRQNIATPKLEKYADWCFLAGLTFLVLICFLVSLEMIY